MRGDINLLPKKVVKDSTKLASAFIVLVILVIILSGVFLVYLPLMQKLELEKEIAAKELEMGKYTATQEEYDELAAELELLRERSVAFDNIVSSELLKSKVISDVELAIPFNVVLDSYSISDGIVDISGFTKTEDPVLVSQFMVNLRNIENVTNVILSSINNSESAYSFSLTINYHIDLVSETSEGETIEGDATEEATNSSESETSGSEADTAVTESEEGAD